MDENMKEVYFSEYCKTCVNKDTDEGKDPCDECLTEGFRANSHKPARYVESVGKK
jgi:hypothetical protein